MIEKLQTLCRCAGGAGAGGLARARARSDESRAAPRRRARNCSARYRPRASRSRTRRCTIPGSYWGESEAGLIGNRIYFRPDTPLHSVLHEACHFICMDDARRTQLERDAGGDYDEENAVCYLQILLADELAGIGLAADVQRHGRLGLHVPPRLRQRLVRARRRRCAPLAAWRTGSSTSAADVYRNLSVAVISSCVLPGSNAEWPASGTTRRSASGHALCSAHAVCIGHTTS